MGYGGFLPRGNVEKIIILAEKYFSVGEFITQSENGANGLRRGRGSGE
jgi:hypothetical protein